MLRKLCVCIAPLVLSYSSRRWSTKSIAAFCMYLILKSRTKRFQDEIAPVFALIFVSRFHSKKKFSLRLMYYMMYYIASIFILIVTTFKIKKTSFHQPEKAIKPSTKKQKLGITYFMEHSSPKHETMKKLLLTEDKQCDEIYKELLPYLPLNKYKNIDPLEIILTEAKNNENGKFGKFVKQISTIPPWVDFKKIQKAQDWHHSIFIVIAYILGIGTLVGGFSCPEINKVLISSRYWANHNDEKSLMNTLNRLNETAIWLYCVMKNSETLKPMNPGWKAIVRVRLFHSRMRYQLRKKKEYNSDNYQCGIINQAHLIGTLLGFAYNPLSVCKNTIAVPMKEDDIECYIHCWKYIGHVIGIRFDEDIDPMKDFDTSRAWMVSIFEYLIHPDYEKGHESTTKMLSDHVLHTIAFGTSLIHNSVRKWNKIIPLKIDVRELVQSIFAVMASKEYIELMNFKKATAFFELQVRTQFALIRTYHILVDALFLRWLNIRVGAYLNTKYSRVINDEIMAKKGKYKCRFAKYM